MFHSLKSFNDQSAGVADLFNWAALVDEGLVQGKDGSLLAGFFYQGPDTASATAEERNYMTSRMNTALARLGSGWAMWMDAIRIPVASYSDPQASMFPDPITALIDEERRAQFLKDGNHFESYYVLNVSYTPPLLRESKVVDLMYGSSPENQNAMGDRLLSNFKKALEDLEDSLSGVMDIQRMGSYRYQDAQGQIHLRDELVNYLNFALTGLAHPINIPPVAMFTSNYLGGQELWVGDTPKIGENFMLCIGIEGFPFESYPNCLEILDQLPVAYRWSTRMLFLDAHESVSELKRYRRKWKQKARGFFAQVFKTSGGMVNEDALHMATQAENAIQEASSALVTFGYYTPVIILMGPNKALLQAQARLLVREIQREGFACRLETLNTLEAWLGSLPGHSHPNVRRALIHTLNLADLLPLASIWAGKEFCPNPLYPADSPALLYGSSAGATPFRLNLHVGDVGHTLIFGPTGAGKSTLLAMIIAQFRRYPNASIFAFDKGQSLWALAHACGGQHYDIASETSPHFAPLAVLESNADLAWAEEWIATCYQLQAGQAPSPRQRESIHKAMLLYRDNVEPHHRSLTDFLSTVQDLELRSALGYYTVDGVLGHLLDSPTDGLSDDAFTVLEIEELMGMGEKAAIPVLLYLFRRFEKSLKGQPALLVLDEAWVMLGHPVFREKIREWLKVLRKANCAVVLATQSLSDAVKSSIFDVLIESCPTKILLPNEEADKVGTDQHWGPRDLYRVMGLNDTQIQILKTAEKKRHYYYLSPLGRRLFELNLGPIALSFVAISDKSTITHLKTLLAEFGPEWPYQWLSERGIVYEKIDDSSL
jgi:type IV secretion/conjugal transfer VirB4 family ATPase